MKKTLGGDRLGSGKNMKVELHGYERSTHDLGYLWRSSAAAGTLIPFLCEVALPGDTFDIDLNADVKTHPSLGPLFGSFKLQLDVFQAPIRLYNCMLHNNQLGIGMNMSQVLLPQLRKEVIPLGTPPSPIVYTVPDIDNAQINPSALLSYLGIRGFGVIGDDVANTQTRDFNAIPLLAYWEIYKNYYSNKQEGIGAYIHTTIQANPTSVDSIQLMVWNPATSTYDADTITFNGTSDNNAVWFPTPWFYRINYTGTVPALSWIVFNVTDPSGKASTLNWDQVVTGQTDDTVNTQVDSNGNRVLNGYTINGWRYRDQTDLSTTPPEIVTFPLDNIDNMRDLILKQDPATSLFFIDSGLIPHPYGAQLANTNGVPNTLSSQEGLGLKTYQSDIFNNWLKREWIDGPTGVNAITAIDTTSGSFTLDTLNLSKKVYDMLNRIAVSGGTYDDWLDVQYGHERYTRVESPMYHGGLSKEIVFQEVVSNAANADNSSPLGTLGGRGMMANKHKGGKVVIKVDEPSYLIGLVSITPRIDYSQGNKWDTQLKTIDDLHKPALDEIGFEELITERMAWWDTQYDTNTNKWVQFSAGKQPAWINYMTNVNQVKGNFAIPNNEMFMVLNRRYESNQQFVAAGPIPTIADLTTYIDPSKYNFIFAETALDAQNFWVQIAVDMEARRKMSARIMPNL